MAKKKTFEWELIKNSDGSLEVNLNGGLNSIIHDNEKYDENVKELAKKIEFWTDVNKAIIKNSHLLNSPRIESKVCIICNTYECNSRKCINKVNELRMCVKKT